MILIMCFGEKELTLWPPPLLDAKNFNDVQNCYILRLRIKILQYTVCPQPRNPVSESLLLLIGQAV
jgi:hypothetical protein